MKATVLAENLKKGLGIVLRGVTNKSTLPILSGVLMRVNSEGLELLSTDLEISFRVKIGVKVKEEGELVVPAKLLFDLVSGLPVGPVDLMVEKQILKISGGGVKTEIVGQAAEEFPSLPKSKGKTLKISVDDFRKKIDRVAVSAARDDTQPVLSGILWEFTKDRVQLVATDRYRLGVDVMSGLKLDEKMDGKKLILPARALQELSRVLSDGQIRELGVEFDEENQQVVFVAESVEMVSRLIAGEFPPFEQILPVNHQVRVEVGREDLLEAVKRASLFAGDGANIIKVKLADNVLRVGAENSQRGLSETSLDVKMEGEGLEMAFNSRYLLDYLGAVDEEKVFLESEGELKPGVFKIKDKGFVQVVMPIRLQE
ncbi:DNA polymerase III subunit beta [Patescibacteria group bacterium]|nr:DNA polymerase III subunit beta [Patescibacteria group bacterium]